MSLQVEVRETEKKGQGLFAKKSFVEGDTIFKEEPYCSSQFCWNRDYGYLACDFCMKPLETPTENITRLTQSKEYDLPSNVNIEIVPCETCGVKYCSLVCKDKAWTKYHQTLCCPNEVLHPINFLREVWKKTHYPPETCSIDLILRLLAMISQCETGEVSETLEKFYNTTNSKEGVPLKLLKGQFDEKIQLLKDLTVQCLDVSKISQWVTHEGFIKLLSIVALNGQGIATSPFSNWIKGLEENHELDRKIEMIYDHLDTVVGDFIDNEGSGLYIIQSKCNHSCLPNAVVTFSNGDHELELKAKTNIRKGEEIMLSYIDECHLNRSCHSRRKILMENYLFTCQCTGCLQNTDPDVTSDEEEMEY